MQSWPISPVAGHFMFPSIYNFLCFFEMLGLWVGPLGGKLDNQSLLSWTSLHFNYLVNHALDVFPLKWRDFKTKRISTISCVCKKGLFFVLDLLKCGNRRKNTNFAVFYSIVIIIVQGSKSTRVIGVAFCWFLNPYGLCNSILEVVD